MSIGTVSHAVAQESWETWPKKTVEPGAEGTTGAAKAGEEGGKKTYAGMSAGTIGWIALGTAAVIGSRSLPGAGRGGGATTPAHPDRRPLAHRLNRVPIPLAVGVLFAVLMFHSLSASAASPEDHPAVPAILARRIPLPVDEGSRLPAIFAALSAKSRETIVAETASALETDAKKAPPAMATAADTPSAPAKTSPPNPEAVRSDFVAGGPIARDYWDAFLRRFDPDIALEHSRWEIGSVGNDGAEILLTHHGADHPARLQLFRKTAPGKSASSKRSGPVRTRNRDVPATPPIRDNRPSDTSQGCPGSGD